jgi:hypothetical protein
MTEITIKNICRTGVILGLDFLIDAVSAHVYPPMSIYTQERAREVHDECKEALVEKGYLNVDGSFTEKGKSTKIKDILSESEIELVEQMLEEDI